MPLRRNPLKVAALHAAVAGGKLEIVKAILEAGADPNAQQQAASGRFMKPARKQIARSPNCYSRTARIRRCRTTRHQRDRSRAREGPRGVRGLADIEAADR
jgi:ankyrin repeat protein